MENFESKEQTNIPIEISFSSEDEILRVKNTIKRYDWYVENRYDVDLPESIKDKLEKKEDVSDDEIRFAVESEYDNQKYQKEADEIMKSWEIESFDFLEKLKSLGRPIPERFYISLTTYGTGGSYGYPDGIQLNINNESKMGTLGTIFHEITHLVIEDLIKKYDIPHWTKERLVNLIVNSFYPEKSIMQRDPENAEQIKEIFDKNFPDIEKVIEGVSKIKI